jgi:C_GCAxxG_C_C family probable redox protein
MMNKADRAVGFFKRGYSCSQAVAAAYGPDLGITEETAFKVSCAFGGGCARQGLTCGAVTGAYIVIGMKYGKVSEEDLTSKEKTYEITRDFSNAFIQKNKSLNCTELLGHDISTPEGRKAATDKGLFTTVCAQYVRDASDILEMVL